MFNFWPFKKKETQPAVEHVDPAELNFSQVDITERFGDDLSLGPEDWIETIPINSMGGPIRNLPPIDAVPDEVFRIASELSEMRESFGVAGDGVYCPVCHIANIDIGRLRTPCPKCGRELLAFGWT